MDSPMTTPTSTSPNSKFIELEKKHDALQSQVDALAKQVGAMNIEPMRVVVDTKPDEPKVAKPKAAKKPKNESTPAFALPWTGTPMTGCCQGIRSNYDTYTQCHQPCSKDSQYCKTCAKNCGEDGIPKDGNVDTRASITKKIKPYIHFMNAKKLSKQNVIDEAAKFGITLPDQIFEKPSTGAKGRPKKVTAAADDSEEEQVAPNIQILGLLQTDPVSPKSP